MPRPILHGTPSPPGAGESPFEYPVAQIDAPDAYYYVARVQISGLSVKVFDQSWDLVREYVLDESPTYDPGDGAVIGKIDGLPILVRRDSECACHGTRMVPK